MINGKKIVVVMPAFQAEKTLKKTYDRIPHNVVDDIILVDDASSDKTVNIAKQLGIRTYIHKKNMGYGANQKTCYKEALKSGAEIVVMLHPDYQYNPRLITALCSLIAEQIYDVTLGSRILGIGARKGGMPLYKYIGNRLLTAIENIIIRQKISEYHTGYRAFSKRVLKTIPIHENSNGFIFDNEILLQAIFFGFRIGEISCPTIYEKGSSSIDFRKSVKYGIGVLITALKYKAAKSGLFKTKLFRNS